MTCLCIFLWNDDLTKPELFFQSKFELMKIINPSRDCNVD